MANSPPGPAPEPVFGSSRKYARDPFRFLSALESAYGNISRFQMGPMDTFLLADPTAIERVLVSEADRFRKPDFQNDALGDLLGDGLLLSEGDTWRHQRDLANPAFGMQRLSDLTDRVIGHAESLVSGWSPGDVIDIEQEMTRVTLDVILDLMMGVELPASRVRLVQEQLEPLGKRFEPDPIRFAAPEWLPLPGEREFDRAVETLDGELSDIITQRRESMAAKGLLEGPIHDEGGPMDLLSVLLRAQQHNEQSREQLRDEMMTMLLAGHDTTALTLTYTWFLLSEHPAAAQRVRDELDAVVDGDELCYEHVTEFEYLEWVLQESMRLYPPVYTMFRTPTEPVELSGYEVPESANLMLPQYAVHRSDRFWDEPDAFDPERWRPDRRTDRPRFAYFPFGGGPRHCIGKHLAMLEAKLILATVAREYRPAFRGETPLELLPSLTAHPRQEMQMELRPR
jgi:cytochrome P450